MKTEIPKSMIEAAARALHNAVNTPSSAAFSLTDCARAVLEAACVGEMITALRPFAEVANHTERMHESVGIWARNSTIEGESFVLTVGHCRGARDAMKGAK